MLRPSSNDRTQYLNDNDDDELSIIIIIIISSVAPFFRLHIRAFCGGATYMTTKSPFWRCKQEVFSQCVYVAK